MSLTPGTRLGRYEIRSLLGAGGMGEVYLAHDAQLNRQVAIKVLPAGLATDQSRLQRFMQEARAASALNHPNILTVHEIGQTGAVCFIVTEFIDGTTLRQRLGGKRLKLNEILDIASQIASALARAHEAGIVHRDIKPDNIMIRPDGIVKVLDFGLAKLIETAPAVADASTRVAVNTSPGVVMGTTAYMSPEQVRGLDLDARTDVFSLGVVLYRMAAGQPPFEGATTSDVIAAILDREPPPLKQASPDVPDELDRIVSKALTKDREERYQVVKDLQLDLKALQRERLSQTSASAPAVAGSRRRLRLVGFISAGVAVAAIAIALFMTMGRAKALTERDTILLADFVNTTGDPVFDGTLKQGLAVHLGQSPYLNIYSDDRVRDVLRLMGRSPDDRVTRDVGREICQRQGLKALLVGTIAGLGSHYVVTLEAVNAQTGDSIAREQAEAGSKEHVLDTLGNAAVTLRKRLGESLASIQKFGTPIAEATTSSLDALKAFSLGDEHRARGTYSEAVPLYRRATELDPNFALAYARLGTMYFNLRQVELAAQFSQKAFDLRERISERERFYVEARYYGDVTGDTVKTVEVYQLWKQTYPRDFVAYNNVAALFSLIGQYDRALADAQESARLNPNAASPYSNIAAAYTGLGQFDQAKATLDQARAQRLESAGHHGLVHGIAFVEGDHAERQKQIEWARNASTNGFFILLQEIPMAAAEGRLADARAVAIGTLNLTERISPEVTALTRATAALINAAFEECGAAKTAVAKALDLRRTRNALIAGGLALALCGETSQTLADELGKTFPVDTLVNVLVAPTILALTEINRDNAAQAIQVLDRVRPHEGSNTGHWAVYVRGLAHLRRHQGPEASTEFRKLLDHRGQSLIGGFLPSTCLYPLAQLGLARAAALSGDVAASRKAYEDLFGTWKNADPDLALLRKAKDEYARLK